MTQTRTKEERRADGFALVALAYTVIVAIGLAVLPTSTSTSSVSTSGGGVVETTTRGSLLQNEGASVLLVLAVPALLALGAVMIRRREVRMAMAGLLFVGCLLGAMSIGVFFLPAAVLLLWVASTTPRADVRPATSSAVPRSG